MNPASIIAAWKRRLTAMAENPPHVFVDTPQHLIDSERSRLTKFSGYSESEVAAAEAELNVRFTTVFRAYLREMAASPGDLFRGSDLADLQQFRQFKADAVELLAETDPALTLPDAAVVFLFHQGYFFRYVLGTGGIDGPVMHWAETERHPWEVAETFEALVDSELGGMERNHSSQHERGGYSLILHQGGSTMHFTGERPLLLRRQGDEWKPYSASKAGWLGWRIGRAVNAVKSALHRLRWGRRRS